ncbi:tyrosine-type recombinase/integrase [Nocardioides albus]|uniref:Integrase n=1 Tax=Nocardioides albus TaxID=1841 RepID=A0A7W5FBG1_9ACTN|nr:tyrosine-type recombinase/integrase [Nocardioides albus]MBB3092349.1 integrase [Nocardioides albus]GGU26529.1 integrase [Nocardioides albus]
MNTSYDVVFYETEVRPRKKGNSYRVRWLVAKERNERTFHNVKLAESFRSELVTAARKGEPFIIESGLPLSMTPKAAGPTWLDFAMAFVDVRWSEMSPGHRRGTADGLATISLAMLVDDETPETVAEVRNLRRALMKWAFNAPARSATGETTTPPAEVAQEIAWITKRSRPLTDLADPAVTRAVLVAIGRKLDGSAAAPATINRKRAALSSVIVYAQECGHLEANPLHRVKVKRPKVAQELDTRVVVNHKQAKAILAKVRAAAPAMEAFLGCIYYAGLRPSEVRNLHDTDLELPEKGWGEVILAGSYIDSGKSWTDDGELGEQRSLKHRVSTATRPVPLPPPLVKLLRDHLENFETGAGGWLFVSRVGKFGRPMPAALSRPVPLAAVERVFKTARAAALTERERKSPLAQRPYDLRHAAVSTWLAAGVPPTIVAQWAGHGVDVLLKVYAHAVDGQAAIAMKRIEEALNEDDGEAEAD